MNIKIVLSIILSLSLLSCSTGNSSDTDTDSTRYIINHTDLNTDSIPVAVLNEIRTMDIYFEHASVGTNVMAGLEALEASNIRYSFNRGGSWNDDNATFSDSTIPDWFSVNSGFGDNARGNPGFSNKVTRFNTRLRDGDFAASVDVAMFKFCYIDGWGAFDGQTGFNQVRTIMESLEADYPGTVFVWWTMPLETSTYAERQEYNDLVRNYCQTNNKWLLDIADIESHDPGGTPDADAGGYERLFDGNLFYSTYTNDGGHLNAAGAERIARAWWVLLARIQGW